MGSPGDRQLAPVEVTKVDLDRSCHEVQQCISITIIEGTNRIMPGLGIQIDRHMDEDTPHHRTPTSANTSASPDDDGGQGTEPLRA